MGALHPCARRIGSRLIAGLVAVAFSGCPLFDGQKLPGLFQTTARRLPTVAPPPNAIQIDVVYVERPIGDARLGSQLWRHVDEIGAFEPETRDVLKQSGFRAGVVGSNPPPALQQILGLKSDFAYEPDAEKAKQLVGHRYYLPPGGQTEIRISRTYPECTVNLPYGTQTRRRELQDAFCQYRVTARRLQDGWAELEFVPLVHHGEERLRTIADENGFRYQTSAKVEPFYLQRFSIRLSVGDMALVTAAEEAAGSLGDLFFRGPAALQRPRERSDEEGEPEVEEELPEDLPTVQRMLIVRLAGMGEAGKSIAKK